MKVLITGAGGFIGNALVQRLKQCHDITAIYAITRKHCLWESSKVISIRCDFSHENWQETLSGLQVDVVIHLAQEKNYRSVSGCPEDLLHLNLFTTLRLAEWAQNSRVKKFVFTSTGNVYSDINRVHSEDDLCHPGSFYGASKLSAEVLLKTFSFEMDVVILRLFAVYGVEQREALLPNIISRFLEGKEILLASGIGVLINPIHVTDCCERILRTLLVKMESNYEVINIGGKQTIDLYSLTKTMQVLSSKDAQINITDDKPKYLQGSIVKMRNLLGDCENVTFTHGFKEVFRLLEAQWLERRK